MKKMLTLLILATALMSCSKGGDSPGEQPPLPPTDPTKIPINITSSVWTRATDAGFEPNDKTGIYVVNYANASTPGVLAATGNHATNMAFTYGNSKWTGATDLYWKDDVTKADFYCYYPFTVSISNIAAHPFTVNTDQSVVANYKASDFLWGKTSAVLPTAQAVPITVKHVMSNILVNIAMGKGYTQSEFDALLKSVTITNTKPNSTINLSTGATTATGTAADIKAFKEATYYRALLVPQTVTDADLVKVTINGKDYLLKQTITFVANKQHSCTVTIDKTSEGVNIGIGGWDTDNTNHGGTAE